MSSTSTKLSPSELIAQLRGVAIGAPLPASLRAADEPVDEGRHAATTAPTESALARLKSLLTPAAKPSAPARRTEEGTKSTPMGDITLPPPAVPTVPPPSKPEPLPDDINI